MKYFIGSIIYSTTKIHYYRFSCSYFYCIWITSCLLLVYSSLHSIFISAIIIKLSVYRTLIFIKIYSSFVFLSSFAHNVVYVGGNQSFVCCNLLRELPVSPVAPSVQKASLNVSIHRIERSQQKSKAYSFVVVTLCFVSFFKTRYYFRLFQSFATVAFLQHMFARCNNRKSI